MIEFAPRLGHHVTGGDGHCRDALIPTSLGGIDGVLCPDDRIVVGKGDAAAGVGFCGTGNRLWSGLAAEFGHLFGLADVPVLTELATEIATCGAKGQDARAGVEMIERFFLDGVDAKTGAFSIGIEHHLSVLDLANKAKASIPFLHAALPGAQVADDPFWIVLLGILIDVPPTTSCELIHR